MAVDGGTIQSSVRIDISTLQSDVTKVEKIYDSLDSSVQANSTSISKNIATVENAQKQGATSQVTAINKVIAVREKALKALQDQVSTSGKLTTAQLAEIKQQETELKKLKTAQDNVTSSMKENSDVVQTQTSDFNKLAAETVLVTASIVAAKKAIDIFATTEQSLANVKAVTNASAEEFKLLEDAALEAGETTRFTAGQAADALFYLSSAGLDARQSSEALNTTLQLAGATGSDLASTARSLTSTMSQYGIAADEASTISNVFAAANSNSQATMEKLTDSLRQTGSVAALMGIELEETVGVLQLLYNAGFQGEAAGRALKSALADLGNESSTAVEKLAELGIGFDEVNPAAVGLTEAIGVLEENNITAAEALDIFGKVAGPQIATLISKGKDEIEKYTAAVTGTEEAARQYEVQNDTLAGSADKLKSALEGLAIAVVDKFAPILRTIADGATFLINAITSLPDILIGVGSGATAAALGVAVLTKAFAAMGVTLSVATGPVALVGGLLVGLVALKNFAEEKHLAKITDQFGDMAEELGKTGSAVDEFVKKADQVEDKLTIFFDVKAGSGFEAVNTAVEKTSQALGLTAEEVVKVGLQSDGLTDTYKEQLLVIQEILEQQKAEQEALDAKLKAEEEAQVLLEQEKEVRKQQDEERIARLETISNATSALDELASKGLISETELLERKIELREQEIATLENQAAVSGEVSDQVVSDIQRQQDSIDVYSARLDELEQQEKDKAAAISEAEEEALANKEAREALIEELTYNRLDALEETFQEELALLEGNEEAKKLLTAKYEAEKTALIKEEQESRQEAEEEALEESESSLKDHLETLAGTWGEYTSTVVSFISEMVTSWASLIAESAEYQIDEIDSVAEAQIEAIDEELEAQLEALGIAEETELEYLASVLEAAIEEGDEETIQEAQDDYDRQVLTEAAEAEQLAIEEAAAEESAAIQYEADLAEWEASKLSTAVTGAQLAVSAYNSLAGIPVVGPALGIAAAVAATVYTGQQLSLINSNKPTQSFATGGIVLQEEGLPSTGDAHTVGVNPGEMILNDEQQANLFDMLNSGSSSSSSAITVNVEVDMDSLTIAQSSAKIYNNGKVRLKLK